jgi:hypothetical protein
MKKFVPISKRVPLEKEIERDHRTFAQHLGWFVTKILATSTDGFPDRFYARNREADRCPHCGRGRVVLMEWKRPGGSLEPLQEQRITELRVAGVEVYVVDSLKDANKILGLK